MIAPLARDDYEDLKAQGLNPTLEDFDRLNQIALRLTEGAETTAANFPRVAWAGDVPFFEPTIQAFIWYHSFAVRVAANVDTENTLWAYALAHAREPGAFDHLTTPDEIESAVGKWAAQLNVTKDEVMRACRYAAKGFDDAEPAQLEKAKHNSDKSFAAENLARVEAQLRAACAALKQPPDALMCETQTRLSAMCEAAAIELGRPVSRDEAKLRANYDLTKMEIVKRLKAEKARMEAAKNGK